MALLLVAIAATGCQYPRDPDGTLNRVQGGVMRVGVTEADPWVVLEGDRPVGGAEVELARRFARDLGARIEWVQGSEEELVEAAKEGQVDLIVGGLTNKSRWKKDVAFTRPYVETRAVVGIPAGESFPDDFAGVPVAAELGSAVEGLELTDSGTELAEAKHVMAVKLGENAFLVRLERFLLNREDEIERLLIEEGRP
jgi:polar amino acid transport system substrate-binding protein